MIDDVADARRKPSDPELISALVEMYRAGLHLRIYRDSFLAIDPAEEAAQPSDDLHVRLSAAIRALRLLAGPEAEQLADDLHDIAQDAESLRQTWKGPHQAEGWGWHALFSFDEHWGRHVIQALATLHSASAFSEPTGP
jgi:hypothetical protein